MNITNFKSVRINDNCNWVDIKTVDNYHSSDVFMVSAFEIGNMPQKEYYNRNIKVLKKDYIISMFVSNFDDVELPEQWKDAEVLYEWKEK